MISPFSANIHQSQLHLMLNIFVICNHKIKNITNFTTAEY